MLLVRTLSPGAAAYFMDGRDPGSWTPAAERLLGVGGPVDGTALRRVLAGRHPLSDRPLAAARRRRRAGWDLIFSAPKSVSLLAATAPEGGVGASHAAAVTDVLSHIESALTVWRSAAPHNAAPAGGLVAARFEHRVNSGTEPHLHTHVLVANMTRTDRGWSAVRGDQWYLGRQSLGALYQMALRHHLRHRGWDLEWRMRPDGMADLAGIPSSAVRAASTQTRLVAAVGPFEARQQAAPQRWEERAARTGYDAGALRREADLGAGAAHAAPLGADVTARVTSRLAMRRSDFRRADVVVALSASLPGGCRPDAAMAWVEQFCAGSQRLPSPTSGSRWTSALARRADDRLLGLLGDMHVAAGRRVDRSSSGPAGLEAAVTVLASRPGATDLVAQAEFLDRLRPDWSAAGIRAAVVAADPAAATRWQLLTGLPPHRPGVPVDVLVIDQADRRATPDLLTIVEAARASATSLVLVEGGTLPRLGSFASRALASFSEQIGRLSCGPAPAWEPAVPGAAAGEDLWGRRAAGALLARWEAGGGRDLLVGLGLEEVRSLNRAVRLLTAVGPAGPASSNDAGRFGTGNRVIMLRSGSGRRSPGLPPYGTFGWVTAADERHISVRWDGDRRSVPYGPELRADLGHGWAVTPGLARRLGRPVLLLGPLEAAPRLRGLARGSIERSLAGSERYLGLLR